MPVPEDLIRAHRGALLAFDDSVLDDMIAAYQRIASELAAARAAVLDQIEVAIFQNENVDVAWLARAGRLETLYDQALDRINAFAEAGAGRIESAQRNSATLASDHAELELSFSEPQLSGSFARLPKPAIEAFVGNVANGTPLRQLLSTYGVDGATGIRDALLVGIARGQDLTTIAKQMERAAAAPLDRMLLTARTEVLRAYRGGHLETMRQYPETIEGWQWVCNSDRRTCSFCLARCGQIFASDQPFVTHPGCRCTPVAVTISGPNDLLTGREILATMDRETQEDVLGVEASKLLRSGQVTLEDFATVEDRPGWGLTGRRRTLEELQAIADGRS